MKEQAEFIDVNFDPTPFTFEDVAGFTRLWDAPAELRQSMGVYLWTIEQPGGYLVNYVGMAAAQYGLEGRIWSEYKDWESGGCVELLDLEKFKTGQRVRLDEVPPDYARIQFETLRNLDLAP